MIVTPGTNLDAQALDETKNNYMMCIVSMDQIILGVSVADLQPANYVSYRGRKFRKLIG